MFRLFSLMLLSLFSSSVFAHPGHDHNHWMSHAIHVTLVLAIVVIVAVAVHMYRRKKAVNQGEK
jgi:membrane protein YdbS with pleckstrin-like domain